MNACIIAYTFYEADARVYRYAEALAEKGHNVDVIALKKNGYSTEEIINKVRVFRVSERDFKEKRKTDFVISIMRFFFRGTITLFLRNLRKRYKIIHVHNVPDFLVFMAFIQKLSGSKIILDIHDILPEFFCQKFNYSFDSKFAAILRFIERVSVRFADHVIVANDLWKAKLIQRNSLMPEKCTTLLNYPARILMSTKIKQKNNGYFDLVYPGTLSKIHGLDIAIKAVGLARKKIPNIRLRIYGLSPDITIKNEMENIIREMALQKHVYINDYVPINALIQIMSESDVGIVPKRGGIFSSEAFSTKTLEYMAANLPVISSKTLIDEFYFDDSMIQFFKPGDPDDMARCIIDLYNNPDKRVQLAKNSKKFIVQNMWENKRSLYFDIINRLTGQKELQHPKRMPEFYVTK